VETYGLTFGNGGVTPQVPVNIEGNEVIQTPDGTTLETQGPSHDNGGINTTLPAGTKVYSNRIKVNGKAMKDRKIARERKKKSLVDLMESDNSDVILKSSLNRVTTTNADQEQKDMMIQKTIDMVTGGKPIKKMATGGVVGDGIDPETIAYIASLMGGGNDVAVTQEAVDSLQDPTRFDYSNNTAEALGLNLETNSSIPGSTITPQINPAVNTEGNLVSDTNPVSEEISKFSNLNLPQVTGGDALSIAGNLVSSFAPYLNTLRNRATDTPNINAFENFGIDGMEKLASIEPYIQQIRDSKLRDAELAKTGALKRGRAGARGINQMRAMDLGIEQQAMAGERAIYDSFAAQMMGLLGQQAQAEFTQDQVVMQGEQQRDLNDRMDSDNFASQLAQNIVGIGTGLQETGKDINSIKEREVISNLINQLSSYGLEMDDQGNIIQGE